MRLARTRGTEANRLLTVSQFGINSDSMGAGRRAPLNRLAPQQFRQAPGLAHGVAHEQPFQGAGPVDGGEAEIAGLRQALLAAGLLSEGLEAAQ